MTIELVSRRARNIVELASKTTKDPVARAWLRLDEYGTWEQMAGEKLKETEDRARELGLSAADVDEEIAAYLKYFALTASLESAKALS